MNQNVKGKATPRHMFVMMRVFMRHNRSNKGIDPDPESQKLSGKKLHQLLKHWGCPLVIPWKLCKSHHESKDLIVILWFWYQSWQWWWFEINLGLWQSHRLLIFSFLGRQCQSWVLGLPQQGQVWSAEVMEFSWVGSVVVKNHGLELANKSDFGNFLSPQFFCRQRNSLGPSRDGNNFAVSFIFISLVLSLSLFIWNYSITFTFSLHLVPTFHFPSTRVQIY